MLARLRQPISPALYRRITMVALVLLVAIVVTGAGVRLTGSGLGCTDWPKCTDETFTPTSDVHAQIEFWNRMITGLVSAAVALAVLGSMRRAPRRRDLTLLSWGLVAGVVGQIVLGGLVVLSHLNPWLVQGHFVLSMVLVTNAMVLTHRAGQPDGAEVRPIVAPELLRWGRIVLVAGGLVLLTGTLVTGSGPHSGSVDEGEATTDIQRLPFEVADVARLHGAAVWAFLAIAVWGLVAIRRRGVDDRLQRVATSLVTVIVLQGAVGYTQYATEVPPALVGLHVLGASLTWVAVVAVALHLRAPLSQEPARVAPSGGAEHAHAVAHGGGVA